MRVTIFKNVKASWPQETELDDIVRIMMSSPKICERTQTCRQCLAKGDKRGFDNIKITCFPAFAPSVNFYEGKARVNVIGLTDLCYLDIDHIENESLIIEALDILRNDPNVVMASRSVSGRGLHFLVRYQLKGMENPPQRTEMSPNKMQSVYGEVFEYLALKYQLKLGLEPDYHARNMGHVYIVSYDPDLYYNPKAEALLIDLNESIINMEAKPTIRSLECMIQKAEILISKCLLNEAEEKLSECHQWILNATSENNETPKQDFSAILSKLEEYLAKLRNIIEKKAKVDQLIGEVDEDMRHHECKDAHEKIVECQQMLKRTTGPFNNAVKKIRKGVVKRERKLAVLNRELRKEAREKRMQEE